MRHRILFRPDDPAGTGGGAPPADPPTPPAGDPPPDPPPDPPAPTLTQEQFDAALQKRLAAERKKWQTDAEAAAQRASLDETERLKAEKADAEKVAAAAIARANATLVAAEAKVQLLAAGTPVDAVADALKLLDLEGIDVGEDGAFDSSAVTKGVAELKKRLPGLFGAPPAPGGNGGGSADFGKDPSGKRIWTRAEIAALAGTPEFEKHRDDINAAAAEGRIK